MKMETPTISWLYQYENQKTCCFTPGKLLDPYEITMHSHGGNPWCSYGFSYDHGNFPSILNVGILGSEAMKDDRLLLEKLLRLDGRALRYASRKLRGERFGRGDGGFQKGMII